MIADMQEYIRVAHIDKDKLTKIRVGRKIFKGVQLCVWV